MKLVIIDNRVESRAMVAGRVSEALRQADLQHLQVVELDAARIETYDWLDAAGCLVGPGVAEHTEEIIERVRMVFVAGPVGVVLDSEDYSSIAVGLRKRMNVQVMQLGDLVQLASFLIDCDSRAVSATGEQKRTGIVGICQIKGGVGATTLCAAFAACWANHGLSVAALDFDDVNPQLTAWARVGVVQRSVASEFLRQGDVPAARINELVHPVEGFEGRFVVVGQPEAYNEGFHFKANVLDGAPSSSVYVTNLLGVLSQEFDAVVIDLGRSWGVATFAALPLCDRIILVTDDDGMSVRRTLDAFARLKHESDDPEEFNLERWSVVLNAFTGKLITPADVANEINEMELFPPQSSLFPIPFSESGRQWGAPGQTMYETCDPKTRQVLRRVACHLIPFRFEAEPSISNKLIKKVQSLVQPG